MVHIEWKQPQEVLKRLVVRKFPSRQPLTPAQFRRELGIKLTRIDQPTRGRSRERGGNKSRMALTRASRMGLIPPKRTTAPRPRRKKRDRKSRKCEVKAKIDVWHKGHYKRCRDVWTVSGEMDAV